MSTDNQSYMSCKNRYFYAMFDHSIHFCWKNKYTWVKPLESWNCQHLFWSPSLCDCWHVVTLPLLATTFLLLWGGFWQRKSLDPRQERVLLSYWFTPSGMAKPVKLNVAQKKSRGKLEILARWERVPITFCRREAKFRGQRITQSADKQERPRPRADGRRENQSAPVKRINNVC